MTYGFYRAKEGDKSNATHTFSFQEKLCHAQHAIKATVMCIHLNRKSNKFLLQNTSAKKDCNTPQT